METELESVIYTKKRGVWVRLIYLRLKVSSICQKTLFIIKEDRVGNYKLRG